MNNSNETLNDAFLVDNNNLSTSLAISLAILTTLFAILAVGSNLVLILVIVRTPYLHTKTNVMLVSVAFSEFLIGMFVMPYVAAFWYNQDLVFSEHGCEFNAFITSLTASSKSLGMLSVSVDRCLAVSHPLQYSSYITKTTTAAFVTIVWTISFLFACFPLFHVGKYSFVPVYNRCMIDAFNYETFTIVKEVTCTIFPAVAIVITLFVVLIEARSHHRVITIAQLAIAMYSGPAAFPNINRYTRSTFKAMRTYIIITNIYLFTCFPMSIYMVAMVGSHSRHSNSAFIFFTFLTYLCCVSTPLVITTLSSKFKDSVKLMFIRMNRVKPFPEKEAFTISTGLHSILETSMVVQFHPKKDSVKFMREDLIPGISRCPSKGLYVQPRRISVLQEVLSSSSSDALAVSNTAAKTAHAPLRKTLSSPC